LLIGNDPLILSGTPFLVYFTEHASIDPPTGFLYTHFQVSNLVSALLVSSNPTNLVLTSAFHISFLRYSAWMALPTVAAAIVMFPILRYGIFGASHYIPLKLCPPHVRAKDALHDKWGGIFGATLFAITIVLLVGLSAGGQLEHEKWTGVWIVVLPAALAMAAWDCVSDLKDPGRRERAKSAEAKGMEEVDRPAEDRMEMGRVAEKKNVEEPAERPTSAAVSRISGETVADPIFEDANTTSAPTPAGTVEPAVTPLEQHADAQVATPTDPTTKTEGPAEPQPTPSTPFSILSIPPLSFFQRAFPTSADVLKRMPWNLVPFAFSMFILVEGLQHTGWIRVFGGWWAAWVRADSTGVAGVVWLMGMLSVLGCNVSGIEVTPT